MALWKMPSQAEMKRKLYNYYYSFISNRTRRKLRKEAYNIHEIIRLTRKEYPDAEMFIVIDKSLASTG